MDRAAGSSERPKPTTAQRGAGTDAQAAVSSSRAALENVVLAEAIACAQFSAKTLGAPRYSSARESAARRGMIHGPE